MNPALSSASETKRTIPWVEVEEGIRRRHHRRTVDGQRNPSRRSADPAWVELDAERPGPPGTEAPRRYRLLKPEHGEGRASPSRPAWPNRSPCLPWSLLEPCFEPSSDPRTSPEPGPGTGSRSHPSRPAFSLAAGSTVDPLPDRRTGRQSSSRANPAGEGYRSELPAESRSKPVLVEIEYQVPADRTGSAWLPPELHEGAVVLQTLWEVQIPWSQALVGVPDGWADENEWYWDLYVWKRRPWRSFARLVAWVAGAAPQASSLDDVLGEEQDGSHGYLFGRAGPPVALRPWVVSRAWLVAICSGSVLLLGYYLMFFKARVAPALGRGRRGGVDGGGLRPSEHPAARVPVGHQRGDPHAPGPAHPAADRAAPVRPRPSATASRRVGPARPRRSGTDLREWDPTTRRPFASVPPRPWITFHRSPSRPSRSRPGVRASASPGDGEGRTAPTRGR